MKNSVQNDIRIGVFICDCGSNIAGYLEMKELVEYAKTLPNVAFVQENLYTCSEGGINEIKVAIPRENLNRVVVASCTPRTHEPLFMSACEEAGMNPYLFEMANIRDQCSWVHMREREAGTERAKVQIAMAVAKAAKLRELSRIQLSLSHRAMVIGGGVAGMSAALALANMGYEVDLVEKQDRLGGLLNKLNMILPSNEHPSILVNSLVDRLKNHPRVAIHTESVVTKTEGYVGNFVATLNERGADTKIKCGVVIVAIGAQAFKPEGLFNYDGTKVITHLELESKLNQGTVNAKNIAIIQCVGSRSKERTYCSRICCMTAVKNAILIKEASPETKITIFYRDMQMYGVENEEMFRKSKKLGVRFVTYDPKRPPTFDGESVSVYHARMGRDMVTSVDLLVLSTPLIAQDDATEISTMLKVPVNENGFFLEGHVKLKPLDFATDGVYLCGNARFPATIREAVSQGLGAASRAAGVLSKEALFTSGIVADINADTCCGCLGCLQVCPYGAINFIENRGVCQVNKVLCKGCGGCAATCPSGSARLDGFSNQQIYAQIEQAMAG
ncbi:MAG: CoB--CoM heterodisulfide reductase iron-sulfur subunit A family protein [Deltaproteobacteria bacterium]|nr:CoB--CoM heterodisulfide reductase iron-sulfur subunit A family protein [Deltaproteobacteria bacterium]